MTIRSELGTHAMQSATGPKEVLDRLIKVDLDTSQGFARAAELVDDGGLSSRFSAMSQERERMAGELRNAGSSYGVESEDATLKGKFEQAWMSVKDAAGGNDHSLLETLEEAQDRAVEMYETALDKETPNDLSELIRRQLTEVKAGHDLVRDLRDARA